MSIIGLIVFIFAACYIAFLGCCVFDSVHSVHEIWPSVIVVIVYSLLIVFMFFVCMAI